MVFLANGIDVIRESHPGIYLAIYILCAGYVGIGIAIKMLWERNKEIAREKDECQRNHILTAVSAAETIKDSLSIMQSTHKDVESVLSKISDMEKSLEKFTHEVKLSIHDHDSKK